MKGILLKLLTLIFVTIAGALICSGYTQTSFDRGAFYDAMGSKDLKKIESQLDGLKQTDIPEKKAFEGALLAKKAGLVSKSKDKLNLFKSGSQKLEAAISADQNNTEYRFLRLMIQEHAPKVVKYNAEIQKDGKFIQEHYGNLPDELKKIIKNYSKNSKVLKPEDFN